MPSLAAAIDVVPLLDREGYIRKILLACIVGTCAALQAVPQRTEPSAISSSLNSFDLTLGWLCCSLESSGLKPAVGWARCRARTAESSSRDYSGMLTRRHYSGMLTRRNYMYG